MWPRCDSFPIFFFPFLVNLMKLQNIDIYAFTKFPELWMICQKRTPESLCAFLVGFSWDFHSGFIPGYIRDFLPRCFSEVFEDFFLAFSQRFSLNDFLWFPPVFLPGAPYKLFPGPGYLPEFLQEHRPIFFSRGSFKAYPGVLHEISIGILSCTGIFGILLVFF